MELVRQTYIEKINRAKNPFEQSTKRKNWHDRASGYQKFQLDDNANHPLNFL